MKIKGSVALVTGGNRGLGAAFVEELLARGASKVYVGARNPADVKLPNVIPLKLDVNNAESIAEAVKIANDVNLIVNNAGIAKINGTVALNDGYIDMARELMETNYYGVIRISQAFAPALKLKNAAGIINVCSQASWEAQPFLAAYSATKSAVWSFTNALRLDLKDSGIRVVALHVGMMDTDMTAGYDFKKSNPRDVASKTLDGFENGLNEVLADETSLMAKQSLSDPEKAAYFEPLPL